MLRKDNWVFAALCVVSAATAIAESGPQGPIPMSFGAAGPTTMPTLQNTGPTNPNILTPSDGMGTSQDGQIIQNLAIKGSGAKSSHVIQVSDNNVTIENCTIDGNGMNSGVDIFIKAGVTGTRILNCALTGTGDGSYVISDHGSGTIISNCHFYKTAGSVFFFNGNNITVQNNWLERIGWCTLGTVNNGQAGDFHTDDVFIEAGTGFVFKNNCFQTPSFCTVDGVNYSALRVFFIDPFNAADVVGTVDIQNNYLDGGGSYMLHLMGQGAVTFADNVFAEDANYGIVYPTYVGDRVIWTNNILGSTRKALSPPVISGTKLVAQPR